MRTAAQLMLLVAFSLSGAACGDDESGGPSSEAGSGARDGGGGTDGGGVGGNGGSGGAGAGGTGGNQPGDTVPCGDKTCETPAEGMGFIEACCADEPASACGLSVMGMACAEPKEADPRCESVSLGGVFTLVGCCTPEGQCGIDASLLGSGCVGLADAAAEAMMMMMSLPIELPEPRACNDDDAGTEDDAGL